MLQAGYLDGDGQLWLLGRGSDVIRTGSETVHASEVEACLQRHPDVLAAAVVGLPHARLGEQVGMSSGVMSSYVFLHGLYGGEVGLQIAKTCMCTHTGHGAGASARAGCSVHSAVAERAPGILQAARPLQVQGSGGHLLPDSAAAR